MMFVEFEERKYDCDRYITYQVLLAIDDISMIVECTDNRNLTNVITRDGAKHTIAEKYEDVAKKIRDAERRQDENDRR